MKLEMKAIKHSEFASQETYCYEANVYIDGKPWAIVSNEGRGGSDHQYDHPKSKGDYHAINKKVDEYFASLPFTDVGKYDWSPEGFAQTFESWCHEQVFLHILKKDLNKIMKRYHVAKTDEGLLQWRHEVKTIAIKSRYPEAVFLNDLPIDEAVQIFKEMG